MLLKTALSNCQQIAGLNDRWKVDLLAQRTKRIRKDANECEGLRDSQNFICRILQAHDDDDDDGQNVSTKKHFPRFAYCTLTRSVLIIMA